MPARLVVKHRLKYRNRPVVLDGLRFASGREAARWRELKLLEAAGEIVNLERQVRYPLLGAKDRRLGVAYVADFVYWDCKRKLEIIEDAKGVRTEGYKIKRKLMAAMGLFITEV